MQTTSWRRHCRSFLVRAAIAILASGPAVAKTWDFESGTQGWIASSGIVLSSVADGEGGHNLRIAGLEPSSWIYARAGSAVAVAAGRLYRLSFRIKLDQLADAGGNAVVTVPYLKCTFYDVNWTALTTPLFTGNERERATLTGTWSNVEVEFKAPPAAQYCMLDVQKGVTSALQADIGLDDVTLEEVQEQDLGRRFALPYAALGNLQARTGVHPRLFLTQSRVDELRQQILPGGPLASMWSEVQALADGYVAWSAQQLEYRVPTSSTDLQLWQRSIGNAMPYLALAWLLTDDANYLQAVERFANASVGFPTWGANEANDPDLAGAHQLFGLAIVYDWCFDDLPSATRDAIRNALLLRGRSVFRNAVLYALRDGTSLHDVWWEHAHLNNHMMVNVAALATAGLAVFDESGIDRSVVGDPSDWAGLALAKMRTSQQMLLGGDGAYHEGLGYWAYGLEYMLKFTHLARDLMGIDMHDHPWLRGATAYRLYLGLPRNAWGCAAESQCAVPNQIVDFADAPRGNWYGPDYLLRGVAREYDDGVAQWLANALDNAGGTDFNGPEARWLNLLWVDTSKLAQAPAALPTMHHFVDNGIVAMRSDWSGDESLVVLKSGPPLGHYYLNAGYPNDEGAGHGHPDANHLVVFGAGEWILRDGGNLLPGTDVHNTLLVGTSTGQLTGQLPVKTAVIQRVAPTVLAATSDPILDYAVGNAAPAYAAQLGLQRFVRHVVFVKPATAIVIDDIALSAARLLELRFHPERAATLQPDGSVAWGCTSATKSCARLTVLNPLGTTVAVADLPPADDPSGTPLSTIRVATAADNWQIATALSWSAAAATPESVQLVQRVGTCWQFAVGTQQVRVDIANRAAGAGVCGSVQ